MLLLLIILILLFGFGGYWGGVRLPVTRIWTGAGNLHPLENPFVVTRLLIP